MAAKAYSRGKAPELVRLQRERTHNRDYQRRFARARAMAAKPPGLEHLCCAKRHSKTNPGLCRKPVVRGDWRCRHHWGNRTNTGRGSKRPWSAANAEKAHAARRRQGEARRLYGSPAVRQLYGLAPRALSKTGVLKAMKAQALQGIDWFEAQAKELGLVPVPLPQPVVEPVQRAAVPDVLRDYTMPELLGEVGALAFRKLRELLLKDREIRDDKGKITQPMDVKIERLEMDLALGAAKLFARVSESALRTQGNDKLQELLDAIHKNAANDWEMAE